MSQGLSWHIKRTITLAWPMMLAQGLSLVALIVDTIMVGHAGMSELSYLSAGRSMVMVTTTVGIGLINGIVVFTARADGAGSAFATGRIWHAGATYAALLGIVALALVSFAGPVVLQLFGLPDDLVAGGGRYLAYMGFSVPGTYMLVSCSLFLQGISRPKPAMVVMLLIAPLNVVFNWIFIYGAFGLPAMGAAGAALSTTIAQWVGALLLGAYILWSPQLEKYGVRAPLHGLWRDGAELRRFGIPLGIAAGLEFLGMTVLVMFSGRLGEEVISGFEIALNLHIMAFIFVLGTASATAVRVGNAIGARRLQDIRMTGLAGALVAGVFMIPFALAYFFAPLPFIAAFTDVAAVAAVAASFLPYIILALFFDSAQFLFLFSLRAAGDQLVASVLQVFAFLVYMVPAAWLFGFVFEMGGTGIVLAFATGTVVATVLLGSRFFVVSGRYILAGGENISGASAAGGKAST